MSSGRRVRRRLRSRSVSEGQDATDSDGKTAKKDFLPDDCIRRFDRRPSHHHLATDLIISKLECGLEGNENSIFDREGEELLDYGFLLQHHGLQSLVRHGCKPMTAAMEISDGQSNWRSSSNQRGSRVREDGAPEWREVKEGIRQRRPTNRMRIAEGPRHGKRSSPRNEGGKVQCSL